MSQRAAHARSVEIETESEDESGEPALGNKEIAQSDLEAASRALEHGDAATLQSLLEKAFAEPEEEHPVLPGLEPAPQIEENVFAAAPEPAPKLKQQSRLPGRVIRTLIGIAVLVFAVWIPTQHLFQVASAEAVVNARIVTLRAPIGGVVAINTPAVGDDVVDGDTLIRISNPRADYARLDDAARAVQESTSERTLLVAQIEGLEAQQIELESQLEAFRQGRMALLTARLGNGELSASDRAEIEIELTALENGVFIGDSYNDKPSSGQRLDAIAIELTSLKARLAANEQRHPILVQAESAERARTSQLATAEIAAPSSGSVWELLVAPGEEVVAGQDLMRMVDCTNALVTAAVSESVYNQLTVGMSAGFTFREGGETMAGRVVQLTGVASPPSNLAIAPSALRAESYRATISVPGLGETEGCEVGRTGRVVFDTAR